MNIDFKVGMAGSQNLQVLKNGKVVRETGEHHNLILDSCFNAMTSPSGSVGAYDFVSVGTGTNVPINSNTTLSNFLAGHVTTTPSKVWTDLGVTGGFRSLKLTREWTFVEGAVIGNVSEIGTGKTNNSVPAQIIASTSLFTKALVLDAGGNSTSISVGAGEQLRVIHVTIVKIPVGRTSANISVTTGGSTTNHTVEMEAININGTNWNEIVYYGIGGQYDYKFLKAASVYRIFNFGLNNAEPSGTVIANTDANLIKNQNGSIFKCEGINTYTSTQVNHASGIAGILIGSFSAPVATFAIKFTPNIPKNSLNKLNFTINLEFARG